MDSEKVTWDGLRHKIGRLFQKKDATRDEWYAVRDDLETFRQENFQDKNWAAFCWKTGLEAVYMTIHGFEYDEAEELASEMNRVLDSPSDAPEPWLLAGQHLEKFSKEHPHEDAASDRLRQLCPRGEMFVMGYLALKEE